MIDIFFIMFTGVMAVYIIVRAALLDRVEPWYEVTPEEPISPTQPYPASADRGPGRHVAAGQNLAPRDVDTLKRPRTGG